MKFAEEPKEATWHVDSYEPGRFILNKRIYDGSLILHRAFMAEWPIKNFQELDLAILNFLRTREPEIILIGMGPENNLPTREFLNFAQESKIGFEFMGTRQACRAYNLMANEGRNVLAALIV